MTVALLVVVHEPFVRIGLWTTSKLKTSIPKFQRYRQSVNMNKHQDSWLVESQSRDHTTC
jgi:hypothetical protein